MTVSIQGLEQLNRRLDKLEDVAKRPILKKALQTRAEMVREAAKAKAPRRTGALASDIFVGPSFGTGLYDASVQVGTGSDVFYGYFIEFGTGAHFEAAAARALGYRGQSKSKRHNMKAQPFLRPAVKSTEAASIAAVERELQAAIHAAENS